MDVEVIDETPTPEFNYKCYSCKAEGPLFKFTTRLTSIMYHKGSDAIKSFQQVKCSCGNLVTILQSEIPCQAAM